MTDPIPADPTATILDPVTGGVPVQPPDLPAIEAPATDIPMSPVAPDVTTETMGSLADKTLAPAAVMVGALTEYNLDNSAYDWRTQQNLPLVNTMRYDASDEAWKKTKADDLNSKLDGSFWQRSAEDANLPDAHKILITNDSAIMAMTDFTPEQIMVEDAARDMLRTQVANTYFDGKGAESEEAFFDVVKSKWEKAEAAKRVHEAVGRSAFEAVAKSIANEPGETGFKSMLAANAKDVALLSASDKFDLETAYRTKEREANITMRYKNELAGVWGAMRNRAENAESYGVLGKLFSGDAVAAFGKQFAASPTEAAYTAFSRLPAAERGQFLVALNSMIDLIPRNERDSFLQGLSENLVGTIPSTGRALKEGAMETLMDVAIGTPGGYSSTLYGSPQVTTADTQSGGPKTLGEWWNGVPRTTPGGLTPEEAARVSGLKQSKADYLERVSFASDVRNAYSARYNPVKLTWGGDADSLWRDVESGFLAAPEAIATTVVAAIPGIGLPATGMIVRGKLYESYRRNLIDEGMDPVKASEVADAIAPIAAVPEMLLEKLQSKIATGGTLKWLAPAYAKSLAAATAKSSAWLRVPGATVVSVLGEATTETVQDVSQSAVRDAYDAFTETFTGIAAEQMPDVNWPRIFDNLGHTFVQNLAAVGPMGIMAGLKESGRITEKDFKDAVNETNSTLTEQQQRDTGIILDQAPGAMGEAIVGGYRMQQGVSQLDVPAFTSDANTAVSADDAAVFTWVQGHKPATDADGVITDDSFDQAQFDGSLHEVVRLLSDPTIGDANAIFEVTTNDTYVMQEGQAVLQSATTQTSRDGGDTSVAEWVTGWSETTFNADGGRSTVNKLVNGASAITAFHEYGHGVRRAALAAGRLTSDEEVRFYRAMDTKADTQLLPAGKADTELDDTDLAEAFSKLLEAEAYEAARDMRQRARVAAGISTEGLVQGGQRAKITSGRAGGLIERNLVALLRVAPTAVSKFIGMLNAARANFGLAVIRAGRIRKAIASGQLGRTEVSDYIDMVTGAASAKASVQAARDSVGPEFARTTTPVQAVAQSRPAYVATLTAAINRNLWDLQTVVSRVINGIPGVRDMADLQALNVQNSVQATPTTDAKAFAQEVLDNWLRDSDARIANELRTDTASPQPGTWVEETSGMLQGLAALGTVASPARETDAQNIVADAAALDGRIDVEMEAIRAAQAANPHNLIAQFPGNVLGNAQGFISPSARLSLLKHLKDMVSIISAAAQAQPGVLSVSATNSLLAAVNRQTVATNTGMSPGVPARIIDDRFRIRAGLIADAATVERVSPSDAAVAAKRNNRGALGKVADWAVSFASFGGTMNRAFGYNSAYSIATQNAVAQAELNESKDKVELAQRLTNFMAGLGRYKGMKSYGAARLAAEMHEVTQASKGKPGKGIAATNAFGETINYSQMQAVHALMMARQDDAKARFEQWGYNQAFLDELDAGLSTEARAVMQWLTDQYTAEYDRLNEFYKARVGGPLPRIANYSPLTVIPDVDLASDLIDPMTGAAKMKKGGFTPSSLITRSNDRMSQPDLSRSALDVFQAHTEQIMHWIHFANISELVESTLSDKGVQQAVSSNAGIATAQALGQWASWLNNRGDINAADRIAYNQTIRNMAGSISGSILMLRVGTLLINQMNLFAAVQSIGPVKAMKALTRLQWAAGRQSDFMQNRLAAGDPIVQEIRHAAAGRSAKHWIPGDPIGKLNAAIHAIGTESIVQADSLSSTLSYSLVYTNFRSEGLSPELAHRAATREMDQLLQPTRGSQRSLMEIHSHPWAKAVWAFSSDPRQKISFLLERVLFNPPGDTKMEKAASALRTTLISYVLYGVAMAGIRAMWKDARDDEDRDLFDDENWDMKNLIVDSTLWPLDGLPVIGSEVKTGIKAASGADYFASSSVFSTISKGMGSAGKAVEIIAEGDTPSVEDMLKIGESATGAGSAVSKTAMSLNAILHLARDVEALARSVKDWTED